MQPSLDDLPIPSALIKPGCRILDVGSGSGYTCAIFYHLIRTTVASGNGSQVIGIDHIPELVAWSLANLRKDGLHDVTENGEITMLSGDGRQGE